MFLLSPGSGSDAGSGEAVIDRPVCKRCGFVIKGAYVDWRTDGTHPIHLRCPDQQIQIDYTDKAS